MVDEDIDRSRVIGRIGISIRGNGGIEFVAEDFREIDIGKFNPGVVPSRDRVERQAVGSIHRWGIEVIRIVNRFGDREGDGTTGANCVANSADQNSHYVIAAAMLPDSMRTMGGSARGKRLIVVAARVVKGLIVVGLLGLLAQSILSLDL